jgi:hypothetical protein
MTFLQEHLRNLRAKGVRWILGARVGTRPLDCQDRDAREVHEARSRCRMSPQRTQTASLRNGRAASGRSELQPNVWNAT